MLGDGDDIGSSDLGDEDLVLVGGVQVNVVGSWRLASQLGWGAITDSGSDAGLQLLCLLDTLTVDVSGMEGGGDDDLGIDDFLVEGRVGALLVVSDNVGVALGLEPLADAELVLNGSEQPGLLLGPFPALVKDS